MQNPSGSTLMQKMEAVKMVLDMFNTLVRDCPEAAKAVGQFLQRVLERLGFVKVAVATLCGVAGGLKFGPIGAAVGALGGYVVGLIIDGVRKYFFCNKKPTVEKFISEATKEFVCSEPEQQEQVCDLLRALLDSCENAKTKKN
ncbi:hypothetical protein QOT17_005663 [Balamuthia mandrillaris]